LLALKKKYKIFPGTDASLVKWLFLCIVIMMVSPRVGWLEVVEHPQGAGAGLLNPEMLAQIARYYPVCAPIDAGEAHDRVDVEVVENERYRRVLIFRLPRYNLWKCQQCNHLPPHSHQTTHLATDGRWATRIVV
jgi:hypothetical protein